MSTKKTLIFGKMNFVLIGLGLLLVVLGLLLMTGGGEQLNSDGYAPTFDEGIYSFRRLTLAPLVIMAGFLVEVVAIMKSFKPAE